MNQKLFLTGLSVILVMFALYGTTLLFPARSAVAAGHAFAQNPTTPTATRSVTLTPAVPAGSATPTRTPIPAIVIADLLVIEYDADSNTIYILPDNPNVKIFVGDYPLETERSNADDEADDSTADIDPTDSTISLDELRGKIVFLSDSDGGNFRNSGKYFAINPDGTGLEQLPFDQAKEIMGQVRPLEGFSPDRSKVVVGERNCDPSMYVSMCALYILDAELDAELIGSDREPSHGEWFVQNNKRAREPVWSPRSDYIVFVSNHEPPKDCHNTDNIFKGTPGQRPVFRRLTTFCGTGGAIGQPSFSPDGSKVVFWSSYETGTADLYIMDVGEDDTFDWRQAKPLRITGDEGNDWQPVWIK